MWRETPSIVVLAAQKRTGAATSATAQRIVSATQEGWKEETTPSTGSSIQTPPSAVSGPLGPATTGTAISAIAAIPA